MSPRIPECAMLGGGVAPLPLAHNPDVCLHDGAYRREASFPVFVVCHSSLTGACAALCGHAGVGAFVRQLGEGSV